jgi:hypothetical protein
MNESAAKKKWEPCAKGCPGWFVSETNDERGLLIVRCDECARFEWDDDAAKLPEARRALAAALVPAKTCKNKRTLARLRKLALREHALVCALSDAKAWAVSARSKVGPQDHATAIDRIETITSDALTAFVDELNETIRDY